MLFHPSHPKVILRFLYADSIEFLRLGHALLIVLSLDREVLSRNEIKHSKYEILVLYISGQKIKILQIRSHHQVITFHRQQFFLQRV